MKRRLTKKEMGVLRRLLERPFPGRDELARQLSKSTVEEVGDPTVHGMLAFEVQSDERAETTSLVPVEARANDEDGMPIDFFLHVRDGKLYTLEFVKLDRGTIKRIPDPAQLDVLIRQ
jgi:hypothetical protein